MKVDFVRHWLGSDLPEKFRGAGPFEVMAEEFERLAADYDVAVMHHAQVQPTRRERGMGAPPKPDRVGLWLDVRGGRFRQR